MSDSSADSHLKVVGTTPHSSPAIAPNTAEKPNKAYLIAHVDVTDPQRYAMFKDIEEDAFARYGGRFIVRGGAQHMLMGQFRSRTIVIEFDSFQMALSFYNSPENDAAKSVRLSFAEADAMIVEGTSEE